MVTTRFAFVLVVTAILSVRVLQLESTRRTLENKLQHADAVGAEWMDKFNKANTKHSSQIRRSEADLKAKHAAELKHLRESIEEVCNRSKEAKPSNTLGGGNPVHSFRPKNRFQVLEWESFNNRYRFSTAAVKPRINLMGATKYEIDAVVQYGKSIVDSRYKFVHGSMRESPVFGKEYYLDFGDDGKKGQQMFKRVSIHRPYVAGFTPGHTLSVSESVDPIHALMPLSGRLTQLAYFLENLASFVLCPTCPKFYLYIVYFPHASDQTNIFEILAGMLERYLDIGLIGSVIPFENASFSRGGGLEAGADKIKNEDALLFFVDVDVYFDAAFLHRCRANAVLNKSVYFPIVFSLYEGHVDIVKEMQNAGLWRVGGFGMSCIRKSDFTNIEGFNKSIVGWGKEDVDLYERLLTSKVEVIRAIDDGIYHIYHDKICDPKLSKAQMVMCQGAKTMMEGDKQTIGNKLAQ